MFDEINLGLPCQGRAGGCRLRAGSGGGEDTIGKFQPQFFRLRQIQPDSFFGYILDRDDCRAFSEQNPCERFGDRISGPIVTEPDAGHGTTFGRVRIIHEQGHLGIAGGLSHPNIVTIFDVGEADGLAFIAMEYVRGHHLSEFAHPERLLPVDTVLDLVSRAADALDYAHRRNVVHRDIKPANIMNDSLSNNLKITDFGIAKLIDANRTRTGIVLGTPAFMSPEQLEGKNVNGHTDLFALGVSLYQLLTGLLPFRGASMTNLMFVIANEPHQSVTSIRGDLPKWLDEVIDRVLAKDPADRFPSAADLAAALRRAA